MDKNTILLLFFGVCGPIAVYLAYQWWKMLDSPDGERWLKRRMQGPFVPLSTDELAEDDARRRQ